MASGMRHERSQLRDHYRRSSDEAAEGSALVDAAADDSDASEPSAEAEAMAQIARLERQQAAARRLRASFAFSLRPYRAARRIQRAWRIWRWRLDHRRRRRSMRRLSAAGERAVEALMLMLDGAPQPHELHRRSWLHALREAQAAELAREEAAAALVQRLVRAHLARALAKRTRAHRIVLAIAHAAVDAVEGRRARTAGATRIQAVARGWFARMRATRISRARSARERCRQVRLVAHLPRTELARPTDWHSYGRQAALRRASRWDFDADADAERAALDDADGAERARARRPQSAAAVLRRHARGGAPLRAQATRRSFGAPPALSLIHI